MDDWMARTPDWMEGMTDLQRDTVARLESREKSCQMRFESLRLDEIDWKAERKKLLAEREALIKQRDEALDLYNDLLNRLTGRKEGGGA